MNFVSTVVVAYYNIGVEQEFLGQSDGAVLSYRSGLNIAKRHLAPKHPLI